MANIITFPVERASADASEPLIMEGPTAEIIIFPGIRFERHEVDIALAK